MTTLILCICGCGGLTQPNSRIARAPSGVEFVGKLNDFNRPAEFYFVTAPGLANPSSSKWKLKIANKVYDLNELTPKDLQTSTAELIVPDYKPDKGEVNAFFGWGTQNRDGAVEIYFKDDHVDRILMRWRLATPSPFQFSVDASEFMSMPLSEDRVRSILGKSIDVHDSFLK